MDFKSLRITEDTRRPITEEIKEFAREDDWGEFEVERGYGHFDTNLFDHDGVIVNSKHIQVIGIMDVFDSDMEAALYAEKFYGEKIFHYDVDCGNGDQNIQYMWFVDEPETRKAVEDYLVRKFGPDHGFKPDYETNGKFINGIPKEFTYQNPEDIDDRETFVLGAVDKDGSSYYLSDNGSFARGSNTEIFYDEIDADGNVIINEFALNGLYFEFDAFTGELNSDIYDVLISPDTVILTDAMSHFVDLCTPREISLFDKVKDVYVSSDLVMSELLRSPEFVGLSRAEKMELLVWSGEDDYVAVSKEGEVVNRDELGDEGEREALFLKAVAHYSHDAGVDITNEFVQKHADEYIYCYENDKDLIDLDFWCDYQELLDEKIIYDEYMAIDEYLDGSPSEYSKDDAETIELLRDKLEEYRDMNKGVKIEVGSLSYADDANYVEGTVKVDDVACSFDYNIESEVMELHYYSEPGWFTGASYEKELPGVVTKNFEEIDSVVYSKVQEFLSKSKSSVDELISAAQERSEGQSEIGTSKDDLGLD